MAKLADAADLKSAGPKGLWGFKSPSRHQSSGDLRSFDSLRSLRISEKARAALTPSQRLQFKSPSRHQSPADLRSFDSLRSLRISAEGSRCAHAFSTPPVQVPSRHHLRT